MALDPVFAAVLRVALALLFLVAALHKARDPGAFRATLEGYALLPPALVSSAALVVLAAELSVAVLLVHPLGAVAGPVAAVALLALYSAAIAVNLARGRRDIDCGCLGPAARQPLSSWLLVRNGVLAAGAFVSGLPLAARPLSWVDVLSVLGGIAMAFLLWHAAHQLALTTPAAWRSP